MTKGNTNVNHTVLEGLCEVIVNSLRSGNAVYRNGICVVCKLNLKLDGIAFEKINGCFLLVSLLVCSVSSAAELIDVVDAALVAESNCSRLGSIIGSLSILRTDKGLNTVTVCRRCGTGLDHGLAPKVNVDPRVICIISELVDLNFHVETILKVYSVLGLDGSEGDLTGPVSADHLSATFILITGYGALFSAVNILGSCCISSPVTVCCRCGNSRNDNEGEEHCCNEQG